MSQNLPVISADYYPTIPREAIVSNCKHTIDLKDLSSLGSGFSVVAAEIARAVTSAPNTEGLYRCVFPEGITGHLAKFKDGSGLLGTIMNKDGIVAQARWIPAEGKSAVMGINPVTLAIAVAMMCINKKLDVIAKAHQEILQFLQQDKEADLEGAVNSLSDIMRSYRYQSENSIWKGSQLTVVSTIKGKAEHNIIFYRKSIKSDLEKQELLHSGQKASKKKSSLEQKLKYYQLSVYLYAYSSFLEIILGDCYTREFLDSISGKLEEYALQYREDYTECYNQLDSYKKSSIESKALEWSGLAGKKAGGFIAKIPVLSKGPVDEALIAAGEKLEKFGETKNEKFLTGFGENRDAGIQLFAESISTIDEMANNPLELFFDNQHVYICA